MPFDFSERQPSPVEQVLRRAYQLLEQDWIQGPYAITPAGNSVDPLHSNACGFCSAGAMRRAAWEVAGRPDGIEGIILYYDARGVTDGVAEQHGCETVILFNEKARRTKQEVLDLFRAAIDVAVEESIYAIR